jgi:hypothetical protein
MNTLSTTDLEFDRRFSSGELPPRDFDHKSHLRLAYIHLATHGRDTAVSTFRAALLAYLHHHQIDPGKFHETLTQAWLQAVWHFMQRIGETTGSEDFLQRSVILHDPMVMLTHYSKEVLLSDEARKGYVAADLNPIPRGATPNDPRAD